MYNLDKYFDLDYKEPEVKPKPKKNKQENLQYLVLILLAGTGYYLFVYLNKKREEAKAEINKLLTVNSLTTTDLDANLWKNKDSWEEYLDSLYFTSQINLLVREIKSAIKEIKKQKQEAEINTEEIKATAIKELEDSCNSEELELPAIRNIIKDYSKKIKKSSIDDISTLQKEAIILITEERIKKQGLHWKRKIPEDQKSWVDKELLKFSETFKDAWTKKQRDGGTKAGFNAPYKIKFPPSLWNELTEKQKRHEKTEQLTLRDDVDNYEFNDQITEWYNKVEINPVRGEKDPQSQKDNNALFYGTGGTGKSITVEKLAYKSDTYPLVVIQGSALTPKLPDQKYSIAVFEKFIFTMADINWTLIDDFGYERAEGGEVRYILFIDEADQISENSFAKESTGLTFLKECMGSDDYKKNESWNLWIMATNHLKKVDDAAYRPGRLSNPLDFSWTLGDFTKYADKAGISNQFPNHWSDVTLDDEDNKWVNRFNAMNFKDEFLPYWNKFITSNPNAEYEPEKEEKSDNLEENNDSKKDKKIKIKWGEMFELFWRLKDSSQLGHFNGKFTNPRSPKIEEVIKESSILASNQISKSIDSSLKKIWERIGKIEDEMISANNALSSNLKTTTEEITTLLSEIGKKMNNY